MSQNGKTIVKCHSQVARVRWNSGQLNLEAELYRKIVVLASTQIMKQHICRLSIEFFTS